MAPNPHGGARRLPSTRRSLLAMGATGLLAGGAAVAIGDIAGAAQASAAVTPIADTGSPDWVNVTAYGADPTGAKDSTAAFNSAIKALGDPVAGASPVTTTGAGCGVIYIPAGTYVISSTITCTTVPVYFVGDGAWATVISFTGTGDCFRVYDSSEYGTGRSSAAASSGSPSTARTRAIAPRRPACTRATCCSTSST